MCVVFANVYADFLELNHCFDLAGWNVQSPNLEDFMSLLPLKEMRELPQEKQGFVQLPNIYNEVADRFYPPLCLSFPILPSSHWVGTEPIERIGKVDPGTSQRLASVKINLNSTLISHSGVLNMSMSIPGLEDT